MSTIDYYDQNAQEYYERTVDADLAEIREYFLGFLRRDARILDFGCGSGRDAKAFAEADEILIAAPFWDLAFPAILRNYIENICVQGLTFYYTEEGVPASLCRAKKLVYVMTAGGPTEGMDFGFPYVDTLCRVFFGIKETACFKAEMLDVIGVDAEGALRKAAEEIDHSDFF